MVESGIAKGGTGCDARGIRRLVGSRVWVPERAVVIRVLRHDEGFKVSADVGLHQMHHLKSFREIDLDNISRFDPML